jgi:uncharacterized protein YgiM (DUF1202 family)
MAGFALPKLRWLLVGAAAAGIWASTQEPPKREHWRKQREAESAQVEKKQAPKPAAQAARAPRPSEIVTASIPKPKKPSPRPETMRTTEKVRLRKEASTSSEVVAMLKGGMVVTASSTDGKWRRVSVDNLVGWVHTDYLAVAKPSAQIAVAKPDPGVAEIPRPQEAVASQRDARGVSQPQIVPASVVPVQPADKSLWGAMRPARAPQEGDCQCPYDLMLNGDQCGDRSAYAKGKGGECYF